MYDANDPQYYYLFLNISVWDFILHKQIADYPCGYPNLQLILPNLVFQHNWSNFVKSYNKNIEILGPQHFS